ncbi:hypothetical protein FIE12Z_3877 [Fusarium flagelliforme]|uniref:Uncharacterized protein n=1 Tax=Fusarium flagelliforme TaxID=2675880 RepID=A0A395MWK3_9HYPO|nr:hypothetical protein FIE12Z_3877 [Fusarium flagelliforme]
MDNLVWSAIQYVQVPFAPQARVSERVVGHLFAALKRKTPEEVQRGENPRRDELDAAGGTMSVKRRDGTVQNAALPVWWFCCVHDPYKVAVGLDCIDNRSLETNQRCRKQEVVKSDHGKNMTKVNASQRRKYVHRFRK